MLASPPERGDRVEVPTRTDRARHWAGPTGSAEPVFGDVVVHSGHGLVIGTGGTPRAGVVTYVGEGDGGSAFGWDGEAMLGDSGSGVRNILGAAAGDLTHLVVGDPYVPAFIAGSTMAQLERYAGPVTTATLIPICSIKRSKQTLAFHERLDT